MVQNQPRRQALIDTALLYLRRGGRIKSQTLIDALRRAAEEALALTTPVHLLAKAIGRLMAKRLGVEVDEETAMALGLQWLNTPERWRRAVA